MHDSQLHQQISSLNLTDFNGVAKMNDLVQLSYFRYFVAENFELCTFVQFRNLLSLKNLLPENSNTRSS